MAVVKIPIGDDHIITMNLTQNDVALDLDTCEDIIVKLYQRREYILAEYSLADSTVDIVDANAGQCSVNVLRSSFEEVTPAKLYAQVTVHITDADFEDGYKVTTLPDILLGELFYTV